MKPEPREPNPDLADARVRLVVIPGPLPWPYPDSATTPDPDRAHELGIRLIEAARSAPPDPADADADLATDHRPLTTQNWIPWPGRDQIDLDSWPGPWCPACPEEPVATDGALCPRCRLELERLSERWRA